MNSTLTSGPASEARRIAVIERRSGWTRRNTLSACSSPSDSHCCRSATRRLRRTMVREASRLCQGCSHRSRHLPGQAALSSTALLRQGRRRRSLTSTQIVSASRRTWIEAQSQAEPYCRGVLPCLLCWVTSVQPPSTATPPEGGHQEQPVGDAAQHHPPLLPPDSFFLQPQRRAGAV